MTRRKKLAELFTMISQKRLKDKDIKKFSSAFIELMAESGIHPRIRQEFFCYTQRPSPDMDRIIEFAEDKIGLILEKI
jgi:hypothetical protein